MFAHEKASNGLSLFVAIWMLPKNEAYGPWPASGEIDIMESRGNENLFSLGNVSLGCDHMGSTLHWGPFFEGNRYDLTTVTR